MKKFLIFLAGFIVVSAIVLSQVPPAPSPAKRGKSGNKNGDGTPSGKGRRAAVKKR